MKPRLQIGIRVTKGYPSKGLQKGTEILNKVSKGYQMTKTRAVFPVASRASL
jgi:hypothetical protein